MLLFPIGTDRPQRRFPWMNVLIIAANVFVFIYGLYLSHVTRQLHLPPDAMPQTGLPPSWDRFLLNPMQPHLYQFITYQFLHQGWEHIVFNMLFLYVFGNNLNEKLGHIGYLAFYLTGGVLAGCGQLLSSVNPTLGASGAISAVCGLYLVLLPSTHIRIFVSFFFLYIDVWEIPSMFFILFKIGGDIFENFYSAWSHKSSVAYMAHLTGTLAGILIGLLLLGLRLVQRDHYDLLSMVNRARRRRQYRAAVNAGYNPYTPSLANDAGIAAFNRKTASAAPSTIDPRIASLRAEISRLIKLHELPDAAQRYLELRAIDPAQFLPEQEQLDIANHLMAIARYQEASAAYEDYLRVYPTAAQRDQIKLILGLIYSRYFPNPTRARQLFNETLPRLHDPNQRDLAQSELDKLGPAPAA